MEKNKSILCIVDKAYPNSNANTNCMELFMKKFIDKGTPLIIAEFGCVGVVDDTTRKEYYNFYISEAKKRGIKCFVWDNNIKEGDDGFGIVDRSTMKWNDMLLEGIISGAK